MIKLYELLVPTVRNDGRPFRLRYHKIFDAQVRTISGGLTIMAPVKGEWVSEQLFRERMIPVRVACTEEQIRLVAQFAKKYYDQHVILYYKISDEVVFYS